MALAEDVVLYDLDAGASAEELIEMMKDPSARWFARARLASLARQGLVAATWNPLLHPRGRDGKFITVFGWVRWINNKTGKWERGQVQKVDSSNGAVTVKKSNGSTAMFLHSSTDLYNVPTPKGSLTLPNPSNGDTTGGGFEKIGGQGGSNPGGLYQVESGSGFGSSFGVPLVRTAEIVEKHDLILNAEQSEAAIFRDKLDGRIALFKDGLFLDANGEQLETPLVEFDVWSGKAADVEAAWGDLVAQANLLADEDKVYIKYAKSDNHAANEVLANRLYELAGVNVAETIMGKDDRTIASKLVKAANTKTDIGNVLDDPEVMARMREDFAIDAWLANWDVAGLGLENTQVIDGYPYRIDAGGALLFRAQGAPKGGNFGFVVGELDTLRDSSMNPAAAKVFKGTTDEQIKAGVERIAAISPAEIFSLATSSGLEDALALEVAAVLIARRQYLLDKFNVDDPTLLDDSNDVVPETDVVVDTKPLTDNQKAVAFFKALRAVQIEDNGGFANADELVQGYADLAGISYASVMTGINDWLELGEDKIAASEAEVEAGAALDAATIDTDVLPSAVDASVVEALDAKAKAIAAIIEPTVDTPDPEPEEVEIMATDSAVAGSAGHTIVGVHPALAVGDPLKISDMSIEEAEGLIGKMVLIAPKAEIDPDSLVDETLNLSGGGVSFAIAFVEAVEDSYSGNKQFRFRLPYGDVRVATIGNSGYSSSKGFLRVVENVTPDDMKAASAPQLKADGSIVYNGKTVGTWNKSSGWWKEWEFKLEGKFNITGLDTATTSVSKKTDLKNKIHSMMLLEAPPVKAKKGSTAAAKVATIVKTAEAPNLAGATYANGDTAKLGDWVASVKGGGGFVGKIIGWPSQDTDPGIVFVADSTGVQKAIKLSGSKKVSAPSDTGPTDDTIPNAYIGHLLADGKTPAVGQKVAAGKPGSTPVEGYIVNINPKQGWVYIQTPKGKVSKTMSITKVLEDPQVWWNYSPEVAMSVMSTPVKPKSGKKKVPGIGYPGPDGALVEQDPSEQQEFLEANPKRKLTKDGYVPKPGMHLRNNAGDELVVLEIAGEWDVNPNKLKTWNVTQQKMATTSTTSVEVDHAAMLTGFDGEPLKSVNAQGVFENMEVPDGATVWRVPTYHSIYMKLPDGSYKHRNFSDWQYYVSTPNGVYIVYDAGDGNNTPSLKPVHLQSTFKWQSPKAIEQVAVADSSSTTGFKLGIAVKTHEMFKHSTVEFPNSADQVIAAEPQTVNTPSMIPTDTSDPALWLEAVAGQFNLKPLANETTPAIVVDLEDGKLGFLTVPPFGSIHKIGNANEKYPPGAFVNPKAYTGDIEDVNAVADLIEVTDFSVATPDVPEQATSEVAPDVDVSSPAKTLPQTALSVLTPPPPPPTTAKKTEAADPELLVVTSPSDLADKPKSLVGATSMADGVKAMLDKKDSKDAGSAITYATGDSDYIEDMAIRYNVEKRADGTEHLVMRFRLREDVSEETLSRLVTFGNAQGKKGAWKIAGTKYAQQMSDGDLISVYVSTVEGNPLKPSSTVQRATDEPNARVIGSPVLVGKSPKNPELDLYRVTVVTQDGSVGQVDMEQRSDGTILTFEYDHEAPAKMSGNLLKLTKTAAENGWTDHGLMTMKGSLQQVLTDDTGKVQWNGQTLGQLSKGSGGKSLRRVAPDGTAIDFQAAHSTEGGTGFDTTRRAVIAGEVQISTQISDDRPVDDVIKSLSLAMQSVGVPQEKQNAATDEQLVLFALNKMVTNYHPKYKYRDTSITSVDDPRVNEAFAAMNAKLQQHLGRNVTLDDVRIHFFESGRMSVVWSPEVAIAIGKVQGVHHHAHHGASPEPILGSVTNGLMSIDERWSLGVMTVGTPPYKADMMVGSGDRVYMRPTTSFGAGQVILSPLAVNTNMDVYTMGQGDNFGRRSESNKMLESAGHWEYMLKRKVEPEQITFWIAGSEAERQKYIEKFKAKGIDNIGGRPIEEIVVTSEKAKSMDISTIGIDHFKNDIPLTTILAQSK